MKVLLQADTKPSVKIWSYKSVWLIWPKPKALLLPKVLPMNVFHMQGTIPLNINVLCLSMSWGKHFGPSQVHIKDNEMHEQHHSMIK